MVKIKRSFPPPPSLKEEAKKISGSYSEPDVIRQLISDFHNKCYICEMKDLQDPEVEHLLPHKNGKYPERKFDWENLFWSCGHCNGVKNKDKYDEGILNCCREDPEKAIHFRMKEDNVDVSAINTENRKAVLTAELIQEVFNIKNTGMRVYKSTARLQELNSEMNVLYDKLEEMRQNPESKTTMRKLRGLLRRESRYAAFKRNYIRENQDKYPKLMQYIEEM